MLKNQSVETRFQFGKNWKKYHSVITEQRINEAEKSLKTRLHVNNLHNKTFLDVGSGSGIFSLAARRLDASVVSFDYDENSVHCTESIKKQFFTDDSKWKVLKGSILDPQFITSLGRFDIVYAWGVLHHTGNLQAAMTHADIAVKPGGLLFLAIYNDQGSTSRKWRAVKKIYCSSTPGKILITSFFYVYWILSGLLYDVLHLHSPFLRYSRYYHDRGMSVFHDWNDWLGGYPFETARPEHVFDFYYKKNYKLIYLKTCGGELGCNEFIFQKE